MEREQVDPPIFERPARRKFSAARFVRLALVGLMFAMILAVSYYAWQAFPSPPAAAPPEPRATLLTPPPTQEIPSASPTVEPSVTPSPTPSPSSTPPRLSMANPARSLDTVVLSVDEGRFAHLFAFEPTDGRFHRLTEGPWRDIHPAVSPDGSKIAFASNRSGFWDLYLLNLSDASLTRLTESLDYDGAPTWSPDGLWIAYESYVSESDRSSLDILIRPIDGSQTPVPLVHDPAADHSPAWDPAGRRIAFVSTRSGDAEIWTADLDRVDERFTNISRSSSSLDAHPAWAPDGSLLSWASVDLYGSRSIQVWDAAHPELRPIALNGGDWPVFTGSGRSILTWLRQPNTHYLTGYTLDGALLLPILSLPGAVNGLSSLPHGLPDSLPPALASGAGIAPTADETLWKPVLSEGEALPVGRSRVVQLPGIDSGSMLLHDGVDESFLALRTAAAELAGWDFLSTLEAAFQPLTAPLGPGMIENWLNTGRAFRFNTAAAAAGWLVLVREDFGPNTFWRVYIRARFQDGMLGEPLHAQTWDLAERLSGDPVAYEQGGSRSASPPPGYWIDFTRLASAYGWERLPSLSAWRIAYSAVRYNEFVLRDRRDWLSAMLEIYPKAALDTPTPVSSPTMTLTPSSTPQPTPTMTRTPYKSKTPTVTPTRRPTNTPTFTATPWPTRTPTSTPTPRPTRTPTAATPGS